MGTKNKNIRKLEKIRKKELETLLFLNIIKSLIRSNIKQIAIFGAGLHTKRLLEHIAPNDFEEVIILDDDPKNAVASWNNESVISPRELPKHITSILISSDTIEDILSKRISILYPSKQIITLYNNKENNE